MPCSVAKSCHIVNKLGKIHSRGNCRVGRVPWIVCSGSEKQLLLHLRTEALTECAMCLMFNLLRSLPRMGWVRWPQLWLTSKPPMSTTYSSKDLLVTGMLLKTLLWGLALGCGRWTILRVHQLMRLRMQWKTAQVLVTLTPRWGSSLLASSVCPSPHPCSY